MFGGVGIYAGDLFFALIADDTLYLKVDESNRTDFETRGIGPFRPYGETGEAMQYYPVPDELVEDGQERSDFEGKFKYPEPKKPTPAPEPGKKPDPKA